MVNSCSASGGFLDHTFDLKEIRLLSHPQTSNRPEVGEHRLAGGLDGRDGAFVLTGHLDELLGTLFSRPAKIQVVPHQMKEGLFADVIARTQEGLPIPSSLLLHEECQSINPFSGRVSKGLFCAWTEDHGDRIDARRIDFLNDHFQGGFFNAISVDQSLQW
jgi:hypothetical protein